MKEIEREHPEHLQRKAMWKKYRDLYAGGEQFVASAREYLIARHNEPAAIYGERLQRVFYENYIGSIIDWYAATLFRREPVLTFEGPNEHGRRFFGEFAEDCDFKGTGLSDFFRARLTEALVSGSSLILVDFPRRNRAVATRAEEEAAGLSRAFLAEYRPEDLTNWSRDEKGEYDWVVLRTSGLRKESLEGDWKRKTRWLYLDRERYQRFERDEEAGGDPVLADEGLHALAKQGRVPLFELRIPEGLWLMNKAALLQLEHFNKSNALAWGITMSLFAMPVIFSDNKLEQTMGESYYLQLGPNDRFSWTEPEGKVHQIAEQNLARLREEIYRICYLMTQAGGPLSGNPASGLSKQRDFSVTQEVLRAYGDAVKDTMKKVLRAVNAAREDGLTVDVGGLDEFDIGDFSGELADAERLLALGAGSMTLRREVLRKLAHKYLCDTRQDVKDRISQEISEWVASTESGGANGSEKGSQ